MTLLWLIFVILALRKRQMLASVNNNTEVINLFEWHLESQRHKFLFHYQVAHLFP